MDKINFVNHQAPAINGTNLNKMQDNIEKAIPEIIDNLISDEATKGLSAKQGKLLETKINETLESGKNENGNYHKFANGTMICTKKATGTANITASWGALYDTGSQVIDLGNYASEFIELPDISVNYVGANGCWVEGISDQTTSHIGNIVLCSPVSKTVNYTLNIIAIGKWK